MASKAKTGTVIDVGAAPSPEALAVQQEGFTINEFFSGLTSFLKKATDLETTAVATLATARALPPPTSMAEDEALQLFVKDARAQKKAIEAHWAICSVFHAIHKRLVAHRTRGVTPIDQADAIGTTLHNEWVQAENRRAAAEQNRLRLEAEATARADQEREAARLDADAIAREAASLELSEREQNFVALFVANGCQSAANAAKGAGYKDPVQQGERLMKQGKVLAAITAKQEALALRTQAEARRQQPVQVEVPTVRPEISKAVSRDRITWGGECLDEQALIDAVFSGRYGIPRDVLMVNTKKLNEYGRSLHELLDKWPGCRHTKKTGIV